MVGAGLSGLAALRALAERGLRVECVERGSAVGGNWRYENDSGLSAAYASLRTNSSRRRTQYPSFPMPSSYGEFVHHGELAAYLELFAETFDLKRQIRFRTTVEAAEPQEEGGWRVRHSNGEERSYDALVVATGHYWDPIVPELPGSFAGEVLHSRAYRTPGPFAGRRVAVVGASQSALDIAAEISAVSSRTVLACRSGHHILPRYLDGVPLDHADTSAANRVPWRLVRTQLARAITRAGAWPERGGLPAPDHPLLEETWPVIATEAMTDALASGALVVKPALEGADGDEARFADGTTEPLDAIVYATGYRISFPFLPPELVRASGTEFPLYRRIVSPHAPGLYFVGILEPGPGLLAVVERQSEWLAALLNGRIELPPPARLWRAIGAGERRTRRRFASRGRHTIYCDRHAYLRLLARDLRAARRVVRRVAVAALVLALAGCGSGSTGRSHPVPAARASLFAYDATRPLDPRYGASVPSSAAAVRLLTYAAPGGRVPAVLVLPRGAEPFPAVVLVHGSGGSRATLVPQAIGLALRGIAALTYTDPWERRHLRRTTAVQDRAFTIESVVDLRRALDLLAARKDVDGKRLAVLGFSSGAQAAAIAAALDSRVRAAVLASASARPSRFSIDRAGPRLLSPLDTVRFVGAIAPAAVFLVHGDRDVLVPGADTDALLAAAHQPKSSAAYVAGHELDVEAYRAAIAWLAGRLAR